jgi:hypothetical protein
MGCPDSDACNAGRQHRRTRPVLVLHLPQDYKTASAAGFFHKSKWLSIACLQRNCFRFSLSGNALKAEASIPPSLAVLMLLASTNLATERQDYSGSYTLTGAKGRFKHEQGQFVR